MNSLYSAAIILITGLLIPAGHLHSDNRTEKQPSGIKVFVEQDTIPVLIGKQKNPVLRINVKADGDDFPDLTGISLRTVGTNSQKDISDMAIYFSGSRSDFRDAVPLGEPTPAKPVLVFPSRQALKKGDNYFWVSLKISGEANLLNRIGVLCEHIELEGEVKLEPVTPVPAYLNRIGIALRRHGEDGVDTYRIPGLATTNEGTLIAVYDNRYNGPVDLQADVDVGMSRSTDGGQTWEPMKVIMDMGTWGDKPEDENGIGDPSVLVDRGTGTIWVAAVWAHGTPGKRNWHSSRPGMDPVKTSQFVLVKSEDDGKTWSEPVNITSFIKDPAWYLLLQGPGKGITLSDGTIVFPAQFKDHEQMPHSTIVWSKDHGKNWSIGTGAKPNTTEAQLIELEDGSIMLNMRDNRGGSRSVYTSRDLGTTWEIHPTSRSSLVEPVCNASLIKGTFLVNGEEQKLVLFVNPNSIKGRHHMTIKMSTDDGKTWPEKYWLLLDEGRGRGYPSMTRIDDEHIGILYEGSQADLVFEKVHINELINR